MFPYLTTDEVSSKSGLSTEQILRLGMSGELVFSVLEHRPQNYEEINEAQDGGGNTVIHTKTNESVPLGSEGGLKLRYIATEDLINIVTNDAPNRKTILRAIFNTRDLDPKKGKWFLNNPMKVSLSDVVLSSTEWEKFSNGKGKELKKYIPLSLPEKMTLSWLWSNLPLGMWVKIAIFAFSVLSVGIYLGQSKLYVELQSKFTPANEEVKMPNN